jgi:hypothetical protein
VLVLICRQRGQGLELGDRVEPGSDPSAIPIPPPRDSNRDHWTNELEHGRERQRDLEVTEEEERQRHDRGVLVATVDLAVAMEPVDDLRRWLPSRAEACLQLPQPCALERLPLERFQQAGEHLEVERPMNQGVGDEIGCGLGISP